MRIRLLLGTVAIVLVATPMAVFAVTTQQDSSVGTQAYNSTGAEQTNSTSWQNVAGLTVQMAGPGGIAVSAELTQGKALFRVRTKTFFPANSTSTYVAGPGATEFSAPGSQAFTFYNPHTCQTIQVQWRRVGGVAVRLSKATVYALYEGGCG